MALGTLTGKGRGLGWGQKRRSKCCSHLPGKKVRSRMVLGIDYHLGSCLGLWAATVTYTIPYRASFGAVHSLQRVFHKPQCPDLDSTGFPRGRENYTVTAGG